MEKRSFRLGVMIESKIKQIPPEFKDVAENFSRDGFVTIASNTLINWARTGSLHWTVSYTHLTLPTIPGV